MKIIQRITAALLLCLISTAAISQTTDEEVIRSILDKQTSSWNKGNLEEFMKGYWRHDSLMFIGKTGITYGFLNTLENYRKGYSDTTKMGKLSFDIIKVEKLSPDYFFVVGKWFLNRTIGDLAGHYTLLFRRINGRFYIVADHSS